MTLIQSTGRMYLEIGNPTINDDSQNGYEEGNFWKNVLLNNVYQCRNPQDGNAVWGRVGFEGDDIVFNNLKTTGSIINKITSVSSYPYNVATDDYIILAGSGTNRQVTMPSPVPGQMFIIKDSSGTAVLNNLTISGGGVNIDGLASIVINLNFGARFLVSDGSNWYSL